MERKITNYLLEWNYASKKGRIVLFFESVNEITPYLDFVDFQNILEVLKKENAFLKDGIFYNKLLKPSKPVSLNNESINELNI